MGGAQSKINKTKKRKNQKILKQDFKRPITSSLASSSFRRRRVHPQLPAPLVPPPLQVLQRRPLPHRARLLRAERREGRGADDADSRARRRRFLFSLFFSSFPSFPELERRHGPAAVEHRPQAQRGERDRSRTLVDDGDGSHRDERGPPPSSSTSSERARTRA